MIYLATPYSHKDPGVVWERYREAAKYTVKCLREGEIIFSPIVYCHQLAIQFGLQGDWSFWKESDTYWISVSSEVRVYMLSGWDTSVGVTAEIAIAKKLEIKVTYQEVV